MFKVIMVYLITKCTAKTLIYYIYCNCNFSNGCVNASREHAYNKESNQLWQKSSFYLKKIIWKIKNEIKVQQTDC